MKNNVYDIAKNNKWHQKWINLCKVLFKYFHYTMNRVFISWENIRFNCTWNTFKKMTFYYDTLSEKKYLNSNIFTILWIEFSFLERIYDLIAHEILLKRWHSITTLYLRKNTWIQIFTHIAARVEYGEIVNSCIMLAIAETFASY